MATLDHTPRGRGYRESLIYFHHDKQVIFISEHARHLTPCCPPLCLSDYWSSAFQLRCNGTSVTDLWRTVANNASHPQGPARGFNSTCVGMSPEGSFAPADCHPGPHGDHWWGGYEDSLFEQHVLAVIDRFERDESLPEADQKKFFIVWAPHIVHAPLQVPDAVYERFNAIGPTDQVGHERQLYAGMVNFADMAIGNVTAALKAKGIWNDLLLVFLSDNGGEWCRPAA